MANPILMNGVASPVSIYETTTINPGHPIGTRGVLDDRAFHWTKFMDSTAIGPNKLVQAQVPIAGHTSEATGAELTAGATSVTMVISATVAAQDAYKDGYLKVEGGTAGIGQIFRIRTHTYTSDLTTPTTWTLYANLYDPVTTTTTGSEVLTLVANPWANVVIQPTSVSAPAVGVTMVNFPAAATAAVPTYGYERTAVATWTQPVYGWIQTWGVCSVLNGTDNLVCGSGVIPWGTTTAGAIGVAVETDILQRIGVSMETITTDNIYASAFLQIA